MLVLKRKAGESVTIITKVGNIVVTVFRENRWGKIDLAIEAPREIEIVRTELLTKEKSKEDTK